MSAEKPNLQKGIQKGEAEAAKALAPRLQPFSIDPVGGGIGAGPSQRSAIAVTIIGGQMLCLLLTLLVPVGYSTLEDIKGWMARRKAAPTVEALATGD
jgi:hypothetical protein